MVKLVTEYTKFAVSILDEGGNILWKFDGDDENDETPLTSSIKSYIGAKLFINGQTRGGSSAKYWLGVYVNTRDDDGLILNLESEYDEVKSETVEYILKDANTTFFIDMGKE